MCNLCYILLIYNLNRSPDLRFILFSFISNSNCLSSTREKGKIEERDVRVMRVIWRLYKNIKGKKVKMWST